MSKLEKQNVLQYMFTESIFFDIPHNFKYSHFNIFIYFIIPLCYQKEYQLNFIYIVEPPDVPLLIIISELYEDMRVLCIIFKHIGEKS
jgi:hypothetical protein